MDKIGPVVSSAHLAAGEAPELSEFEFALTMANNAFQRWMSRCMTAAGQPELAPLEILIIHTVRHRSRPKTLADICLVLNVEDTYTVSYALKKLEKRGLVKGGKAGKEKTAEITPEGEAACVAYREIREAALVRSVKELGLDPEQLSRLASVMRALSGQYDQAARSAASL